MLSVWAFWMPVVQTMILHYSTYLGITAGPILNGFITCHSILCLSAYAAAAALNGDQPGSKLEKTKRYSTAAVLLLFSFTVLQSNLWTPVNSVLSSMPMLTPVHLQMGVAAGYSLLLPSKLFLFAIPAISHTLYWNPHFRTSFTNDSLASHKWTLLDRRWSNTGYISVLESSELQYRLMRADHSLLGGEWLLTTARKQKEGWLVPEPVYAVFSILESVRLLQLSPEVPDTQAQALVIGLGIGTAPKAFIEHGINTTIVELDPAVHSFATQYFNLPTNHTAVLQDAVSWVADAAIARLRYSYIIHDVFTGGAEPLALFTTSFLQDLRSLLTPNGAIALNYAGDLSLPLTKLVLNTINTVFENQCKIFRDSPLEAKNHLNSAEEEDFLNMVIFCRNTPGAISFRKPIKADFLRSRSREHYMLPKAELEIHFPHQDWQKVLRAGGEKKWSSQQAESAKRHWRIMRKVLPDVVWELW